MMVRFGSQVRSFVPGFTLALVTAGLPMAAGCGSDDAVLPGMTCDAYGCSSTPSSPSVPNLASSGTDASAPKGDAAADVSSSTAATPACKYSSECGSAKVCVNGQCLASCGAGTTCAAGFQCQNEACRAIPTTGACTSSASCGGATPVCAGGQCAIGCASDATCGAGTYCLDGGCVVDTRPAPNCRVEADCASASGPARSCVEGYCKFRCTTGDDCLRIDGRIPVCGADKVCRSATEANPECTSKSECKQGQDCVGNVCK
ncbi:MAG: hypothetical protein U0169_09705 [Polyangiaceae bacterium]